MIEFYLWRLLTFSDLPILLLFLASLSVHHTAFPRQHTVRGNNRKDGAYRSRQTVLKKNGSRFMLARLDTQHFTIRYPWSGISVTLDKKQKGSEESIELTWWRVT